MRLATMRGADGSPVVQGRVREWECRPRLGKPSGAFLAFSLHGTRDFLPDAVSFRYGAAVRLECEAGGNN